MVYNLTDKMNFEDSPKIQIKDHTITVKADAPTVLKVMELVTNAVDDVSAFVEAKGMLFSKEDNKVIDSLNLSMADFIKLMQVAMSLAVGEDPDAAERQGE